VIGPSRSAYRKRLPDVEPLTPLVCKLLQTSTANDECWLVINFIYNFLLSNNNNNNNKYISGDWPISTHADLRPHTARYSTNGASVAWRLRWGKDILPRQFFLVARLFVRFWASGRAKFPKMGDYLPRTPMNHRAKFDAASLTLAREIRNHTNKKTVNDISTTWSIGMCGYQTAYYSQ